MDDTKNLAETLAEVLPKVSVAFTQEPGSGVDRGIVHLAVPNNHKIHAIDFEPLLPSPRRTKAVATMGDSASFCDYVNRHADDCTVVWCDFNPKSYALSFTAVIDEHSSEGAGWRAHQAKFTPGMSAEWTAWTANNRQAKDQVAFAEFIEANENDIAAVEGMPTSLQMHAMATEFVARQDMAIKSTVRLQSGGVQLTYIADPDKGTVEQMKLFEKFALGIPVFWQTPKPGEAIDAYRIDARLKYRLGAGKVSFSYELIRPDLVHQRAALEAIEKIRGGIGATPLLMGSCT